MNIDSERSRRHSMRIYANMSSLAPWVDPLPSDLDSLREELGVTYTNYRTGDEDVPVRRIYWTGRLQRDPKDRTKTDPTKPRRWQLLFNIASSSSSRRPTRRNRTPMFR
jgi:hypothetical protein